MTDARDGKDEGHGDPPEGGGLAGGRDAEGAGPGGSPDPRHDASPPPEGADRSVPTSTRIAQGAVLVLAALFAVFALVNSQPVDFSWVFGETQVDRDATGEVTSGGVPLIVLLLLAFIVGAVLGGWWTWQAARSRQRARDDRR